MGGISTCTASWTDDRVEMLKHLYADGLSASQIAGELGGVTRNGVIGKVHRLGLHLGTSNVPRMPRAAKPRPRKEPHIHIARPKRETPPRARDLSGSLEPLVIETPPEDTAIPMEQRRTIVTIEDGLCRWPVGDPGTESFFMCGGKVTTRHIKVEGEWREVPSTYCAHHHERSIDRGGMRASLLRAEQRHQNFYASLEQRRAFGG